MEKARLLYIRLYLYLLPVYYRLFQMFLWKKSLTFPTRCKLEKLNFEISREVKNVPLVGRFEFLGVEKS